MSQIEMFETLPLDEAQPCSRCGGIIVTQHFSVGHIESEYVDREGRCWKCARSKA